MTPTLLLRKALPLLPEYSCVYFKHYLLPLQEWRKLHQILHALSPPLLKFSSRQQDGFADRISWDWYMNGALCLTVSADFVLLKCSISPPGAIGYWSFVREKLFVMSHQGCPRYRHEMWISALRRDMLDCEISQSFVWLQFYWVFAYEGGSI